MTEHLDQDPALTAAYENGLLPDGDDAAEQLPPDATAREAAKLAESSVDETLRDRDFTFVTRHLSETEKAAVIAVLDTARREETKRRKRVQRIEREPWSRAQRIPRSVGDLLDLGPAKN